MPCYITSKSDSLILTIKFSLRRDFLRTITSQNWIWPETLLTTPSYQVSCIAFYTQLVLLVYPLMALKVSHRTFEDSASVCWLSRWCYASDGSSPLSSLKYKEEVKLCLFLWCFLSKSSWSIAPEILSSVPD